MLDVSWARSERLLLNIPSELRFTYDVSPNEHFLMPLRADSRSFVQLTMFQRACVITERLLTGWIIK